jgi:NIMA (never in mitosis gene a)-related kinase
MEYADNGDLYERIVKQKDRKMYLPENHIWKYMLQITKALKHLHGLDTVHRDLKCANIFLMKDGTVKLGDLNVSKVCHGEGLMFTQTGTPYYASPEVWKDKPYDAKSDIWSLG